MNNILDKAHHFLKSCTSFFTKSQYQKQPEPEQMHFVPISQHQDYQTQIKPLLLEISKAKLKNYHLVQKLLIFQQLTQIHKEQLPTDYSHFKDLKQSATPIFYKIAEFILLQQEKYTTKKLPLLLQSKNQQITLDKEDILYLMSLMAMNLVPPQQWSSFKKRLFPYPYDFSQLFSDQEYKTKTVIEYLRQHFLSDQWKKHDQKFIIKRKYLADKIQDIIQKNKNSKMVPFQLKSDHTSIQNFTGHAKVDFANKFIGGGALGTGCVQEEIMFANHPELFTSVLFCEVLNDHEAITFSGFKKYSKNEGYGWNTKYAGQEKITPDFYQQKEYIVAIDALNFPTSRDMIQTKNQTINRELKKAYVGFSDLPEGIHVATGNWGCGAFNGDVRMKFMIQWLACSMANRKMIYCPFGHENKISESKQILKELEKKEIGEVYEALIKGGERMKSMDENIFERMKESV